MESAPREEMDALLDLVVRFAQERLEQRGGFEPFAASVDAAGQLHLADDETAGQEPERALEALVSGLAAAAGAGEIRAAAVCCDVDVRTDAGGTTDAICVELEHLEADPVNVYVPYAKGRGVEYGELFARAGSRRVFTD